jgi:hypothetical protein
MSKKATEAVMNAVHSALADVYIKYLTGGVEDENGNPLKAPPAAVLKEIREFLKDNKIQGTSREGSTLGTLASILPSFPTESEDIDESFTRQ